MLKGDELRYQKIGKLAVTLITITRRLRPYFQGHKIIVRNNHPIEKVVRKLDLTGRMVLWSVELSESLRAESKPRVLENFVVELVSENSVLEHAKWTLPVDGASNFKGSGAGITFEIPGGLLIEKSLGFEFRASNNQAKDEALIAKMRAQSLKVKSDFQLVTSQVSGEF